MVIRLTGGADDSESAAAAVVEFENKVQEVAKEVKRRQSPEGHFKQNTPLLERRRIQHVIPDGAFKQTMTFDRILVSQMDQDDGETYGDTGIFKPEAAKAHDTNTAPRGILLAAGLEALDSLRSNGIDLGHIVTFIKNAPWHMRIDNVMGHDMHALIMRAGDITGSEDLATALQSGECRIEAKETVHEDGVVVREHHYVDNDGKTWSPTLPFIGDDF